MKKGAVCCVCQISSMSSSSSSSDDGDGICVVQKLQCQCEGNTCGDSCERCCPKFNQVPWQQGTYTEAFECQGSLSLISSNSSNRQAKKFEFSFSNDIYLTWFQNTPEGYQCDHVCSGLQTSLYFIFLYFIVYIFKGALLFVLVSGYVCQIKLYTQLSSPR